MNFTAKVLVEEKVRIEADTIVDANQYITAKLKQMSQNTKLLGIVRDGVSWTDDETTPPTSAPPSGSPGTPTIVHEQPMTMARAA